MVSNSTASSYLHPVILFLHCIRVGVLTNGDGVSFPILGNKTLLFVLGIVSLSFSLRSFALRETMSPAILWRDPCGHLGELGRVSSRVTVLWS